MMQWGPETNLGGCYIMVHGGSQTDVFAIESLLGLAILVLNKCFVSTAVGERNIAGSVKIGPGNDWWLSVILRIRAVGGNDSVV